MKIPDEVIKAARSSQLKWKIPASVSLAQWAVESGWGQHYSGKNNPFGIKGKGLHFVKTREWSKTKGWYWITTTFRDYDTIEEAFDDHGRILATLPVYAPARATLPDVLEFVKHLEGTYATAPNYAEVLTGVITGSQNLRQYDG